MSISYDQHYLRINAEAPARWLNFRLKRTEFSSPLTPAPEFTPVLARECSEVEKNSLFYLFTVLNAEAQIILEQFFIFALNEFRQTCQMPDVCLAVKKLMREEMLHARAYRQFLRADKNLSWPKNNLVLYRQKRLKKIMVWFLRKSPVAMILTAAKFETYSLYFSHYLSQVYQQKNEWSELNRLHVMDEVHHVNFDYSFYHDQVGRMNAINRLKTAIFATLFFLGMQVLLFRSCFRAMKIVFPRDSFFQTVRSAFGFARWGVRIFPPYEKTRNRLRENFLQKKFIHSKLLSFIYW